MYIETAVLMGAAVGFVYAIYLAKHHPDVWDWFVD